MLDDAEVVLAVRIVVVGEHGEGSHLGEKGPPLLRGKGLDAGGETTAPPTKVRRTASLRARVRLARLEVASVMNGFLRGCRTKKGPERGPL